MQGPPEDRQPLLSAARRETHGGELCGRLRRAHRSAVDSDRSAVDSLRSAVDPDRSAVDSDRSAVDFPTAVRSVFCRSAVDFHTALRSIFTAVRSFPPAVRKSSAVDLDRTGVAQCGSPSSRAPPSCFEPPSYPSLAVCSYRVAKQPLLGPPPDRDAHRDRDGCGSVYIAARSIHE